MSPWAVPISVILILVGRLWLRQAREAKQTGTTSFTGQWPDNFDRDTQPWSFQYTVFLYTVGGWLSLIMGAALLILALVAGILWLFTLHR